MAIRKLVRKKPITVSPDTTVMEAIRIMAVEKIGAVGIAEGRRLTGIFTERDVMKKIVLDERDPRTTKIRDVMTSTVVKANGGITVTSALEIMQQRQFRHLPIVNDADEIEGIVSLRHILYDMMDDLKEKASGLEAYLGYDGPGG